MRAILDRVRQRRGLSSGSHPILRSDWGLLAVGWGATWLNGTRDDLAGRGIIDQYEVEENQRYLARRVHGEHPPG